MIVRVENGKRKRENGNWKMETGKLAGHAVTLQEG